MPAPHRQLQGAAAAHPTPPLRLVAKTSARCPLWGGVLLLTPSRARAVAAAAACRACRACRRRLRVSLSTHGRTQPPRNARPANEIADCAGRAVGCCVLHAHRAAAWTGRTAADRLGFGHARHRQAVYGLHPPCSVQQLQCALLSACCWLNGRCVCGHCLVANAGYIVDWSSEDGWMETQPRTLTVWCRPARPSRCDPSFQAVGTSPPPLFPP